MFLVSNQIALSVGRVSTLSDDDIITVERLSKLSRVLSNYNRHSNRK